MPEKTESVSLVGWTESTTSLERYATLATSNEGQHHIYTTVPPQMTPKNFMKTKQRLSISESRLRQTYQPLLRR